MKEEFECHITIALPESEQIHYKVEAMKLRVEAVKWSFSCIEGDPQLGQRTFCYATAYYADADTAIEMTNAVATVLSGKGLNVVRRKVEHVIYDSRREDAKHDN